MYSSTPVLVQFTRVVIYHDEESTHLNFDLIHSEVIILGSLFSDGRGNTISNSEYSAVLVLLKTMHPHTLILLTRCTLLLGTLAGSAMPCSLYAALHGIHGVRLHEAMK